MHRYALPPTIALLLVAILTSCPSGGGGEREHPQVADSAGYANLEYVEDFFDFGTITGGEVVAHTFRFRNSGNAALIVKDVIPSCGCTTPRLSTRMLKPNEEGFIEVIFNSKGWHGSQYKSVTLRTNSPIADKSVTIKDNVVQGDR